MLLLKGIVSLNAGGCPWGAHQEEHHELHRGACIHVAVVSREKTVMT
jgi:hypothetical protein